MVPKATSKNTLGESPKNAISVFIHQTLWLPWKHTNGFTQGRSLRSAVWYFCEMVWSDHLFAANFRLRLGSRTEELSGGKWLASKLAPNYFSEDRNSRKGKERRGGWDLSLKSQRGNQVSSPMFPHQGMIINFLSINRRAVAVRGVDQSDQERPAGERIRRRNHIKSIKWQH